MKPHSATSFVTLQFLKRRFAACLPTQRPDAFRTTIAERLLAYAADRPFAADRGTPETLAAARWILRGKNQIRWSALIAGVVRTKPVASE